LALGLALANHHFLTILVLPAGAALLGRMTATRGPRPLAIAVGAALLGALTFAYLPVRAMAGPSLNLGEPTSPARLGWVISAEAFQKNTGSGVPEPAMDRVMDVLVQVMDTLHPAVM